VHRGPSDCHQPESLRARSEWVLRLAPLEVPHLGAVLTAARRSASRHPAVCRAHYGEPEYVELSDADVPIVAISAADSTACRSRSSGGARVDLFGIAAARPRGSLGLLRESPHGCPRAPTLRAMLDWSYEIPSPRRADRLCADWLCCRGVRPRSASACLLLMRSRADMLDLLTNSPPNRSSSYTWRRGDFLPEFSIPRELMLWKARRQS